MEKESKNSDRLLLIVFFGSLGLFVYILGLLFIPLLRSPFQGTLWFLTPFIIFFLLGFVLIFLTWKERIKGKLKKFLLLTGFSSAGILISILLHNIIYGAGIFFLGTDFWEKIGLGDEIVFFFAALVICPIGFLIGVIGSLVCLFKKGKND